MMLCVLGGCAAPQKHWVDYKTRFVLAEGRVQDTGNAGMSHSEAQGVTMLLAVHHGDKAVFDRVWTWTRAHLQVRKDQLLAWKWTGQKGASDINNATDGDIYVAWALLRASQRWNVHAYQAAAQAMLQDIKRKCVRDTAWGKVLLPGESGFADNGQDITVNLSYWIYPALRDFFRIDQDVVWTELANTGVALTRQGRFGRWSLPADWMQLAQPLKPSAKFPPQFGYDAVRIPLFLIWGDVAEEDSLAAFQAFWKFYRGQPYLPPTVDLVDASIAEYPLSTGMQAIVDLACQYPAIHVRLLAIDMKQQDYYSASLWLLVDMVRQEKLNAKKQDIALIDYCRA